MTGLSTHTLRMWEKRYGAVIPERTDAGGRLYSDADVERLRMLRRLVGEGHSIGGIARLSGADLRQMAGSLFEPADVDTTDPHRELRARFVEAIERLRIEEAERMLAQTALSTEPSRFLREVVGPLLQEVGDRWERGELRIVHEHASSAVMRGLLFSLMRFYPSSDSGPRVVVATPAGEYHELGALMIAMLATMHGWRVLYLGTNLPAEEIAFAVEEVGAALLMLSVSNLEPEAVTGEISAIEKSIAPTVEILVGGRAAAVPVGSRAELRQELEEAEAVLSR